MTAQIIPFPQDIRDDVAMARIAQKVGLRFGWDIDLRVAISIVQESKNPVRDPALEAMAQNVAANMGIAMRAGIPP